MINIEKNNGEAKKAYEKEFADFSEFCYSNTGLIATINSQYPVQIELVPDPQRNFFGESNIDDNGETNTLLISVGLTTTVKSSLKFSLNSKVLKKIISKATNLGQLYYFAFCESFYVNKEAEKNG